MSAVDLVPPFPPPCAWKLMSTLRRGDRSPSGVKRRATRQEPDSTGLGARSPSQRPCTVSGTGRMTWLQMSGGPRPLQPPWFPIRFACPLACIPPLLFGLSSLGCVKHSTDRCDGGLISRTVLFDCNDRPDCLWVSGHLSSRVLCGLGLWVEVVGGPTVVWVPEDVPFGVLPGGMLQESVDGWPDGHWILWEIEKFGGMPWPHSRCGLSWVRNVMGHGSPSSGECMLQVVGFMSLWAQNDPCGGPFPGEFSGGNWIVLGESSVFPFFWGEDSTIFRDRGQIMETFTDPRPDNYSGLLLVTPVISGPLPLLGGNWPLVSAPPARKR